MENNAMKMIRWLEKQTKYTDAGIWGIYVLLGTITVFCLKKNVNGYKLWLDHKKIC